jgi:hypothetical protein
LGNKGIFFPIYFTLIFFFSNNLKIDYLRSYWKNIDGSMRVVIQANFIIFATSIQYWQEILGGFIAAASWQMRY